MPMSIAHHASRCPAVQRAGFLLVLAGTVLGLTPPAAAQIVESVAARVNGEIITTGEVQEALYAFQRAKAQPLQSPAEYEEAWITVLNQLIADVLMVQEAKKEKLELSPTRLEERVTAQLDAERKRYPSEEAFRRALDQAGTSEEIYREELRESIERETLIRQIVDRHITQQILITDADIDTFRRDHPDEFRDNSEQVQISHILVACPSGATGEAAAAAERKIHALQLRIQADEQFLTDPVATFNQYAEQVSQEPGTKNSGGDLGRVPRGRLDPQFDQAFAMRLGTISQPFRTSLGYHLIMPVARLNARQYLEQKRGKEMLDAWIADLRARADLTIKQAEPVPLATPAEAEVPPVTP